MDKIIFKLKKEIPNFLGKINILKKFLDMLFKIEVKPVTLAESLTSWLFRDWKFLYFNGFVKLLLLKQSGI